MSKKKATKPQPRPQRWLLPGLAVMLVLVAAGVYFATRQSEPAATEVAQSRPTEQKAADPLANKVVLPAIPRRPRPAVLDAKRFADPEVRKAYEVAQANPGLLEQMPCYCGCYSNPGHTNNLDCFVDNHGET